MLKFEHIEARRYLVESERGGSGHLVDMDDFDGLGACSCQDFEFRIAPKLRRKQYARPCKHICACLLEELLQYREREYNK